MNQCDHIELSTDDPEKAIAFYSKVFGWKIAPMPSPGGGPPYHMFRTGNGGGGITAKMKPDQPTAWMPYISVKSVKAAQASAKAAGGTPIPDYEYVSLGDMGAIGGFFDPTGAAIGLWEPGKAQAAPPPAKKAAAPKKAAKKAAPKKAAKKKR